MYNRNMRVMVFFDLPVVHPVDRRNYAKFRKYLIQHGYDMLQYSVYSKIVRNHDDSKRECSDISKNLPPKGSVRAMVVTEKQYASMILMVGEKTATENFLTPADLTEI